MNTALWAVSPGFESGDLGFHFKGDVWGGHFAFTWKQLQPDRVSRDRNLTVAEFTVWDYGRSRLSQGFMTFANLTFLNYWHVGGNLAFFGRGQDDHLTRGGPPTANLPSGFGGLELHSDSRRKVVMHLNGGGNWSDTGAGGSNGAISFEWKPSPRVSVSTGPSYSDGLDPAQYVMTADDAFATATGGRRYVFAPLRQKTLALDTRVNVLFTPQMSLQIFMQPLVVVGDYRDLQSLTRPKSFEFDPFSGGPSDLDFNFRSLRVNAIFRWEWRLGSTMYVAWTQQREDVGPSGQLHVGQDLNRVFTGPADNGLLIKVSRWFGR